MPRVGGAALMDEFVWVMDSECCDKCGCILDYFETVLCTDCLHDAWYNEEQDYYDGWEEYDA